MTAYNAALAYDAPIAYVGEGTVYNGPILYNGDTGDANYPPPSSVLAGVSYGPGGMYVGTLDTSGLRIELETGRVFKPLTPKVGVLL